VALPVADTPVIQRNKEFRGHLTQTLALAVWLLVVVLLSSVSLSQVGALGCRGTAGGRHPGDSAK
jgi:hypothetical protein